MEEPLDPERSETERTLWHTLDEAGWSDREIQGVFGEYRDKIFREAAKRQRAGIADVMESWGGYLHQDMLDDLIDLIDPDKP
jgi:hypothetical protein